MSDNIRKSFENLAQIFGITIEHSWQKNLEDKLKMKYGRISGWIHRNTIPEYQLVAIEKKSFDRKMWYIPCDKTKKNKESPTKTADADWLSNRLETENDAGTETKDSDSGSYGVPSLQNHKMVMVYSGYDPKNKTAHDLLEEILNNGDERDVTSIKNNLHSFVLSTRKNKIISDLKAQNEALQKQVKQDRVNVERRLADLEKKISNQIQ